MFNKGLMVTLDTLSFGPFQHIPSMLCLIPSGTSAIVRAAALLISIRHSRDLHGSAIIAFVSPSPTWCSSCHNNAQVAPATSRAACARRGGDTRQRELQPDLSLG